MLLVSHFTVKIVNCNWRLVCETFNVKIEQRYSNFKVSRKIKLNSLKIWGMLLISNPLLLSLSPAILKILGFEPLLKIRITTYRCCKRKCYMIQLIIMCLC